MGGTSVRPMPSISFDTPLRAVLPITIRQTNMVADAQNAYSARPFQHSATESSLRRNSAMNWTLTGGLAMDGNAHRSMFHPIISDQQLKAASHG